MATGALHCEIDVLDTISHVGQKFGVELKDKQVVALQQFCVGKDVFVLLPTGEGKLIIYGLLPAVFNKLKVNIQKC